VIKITNAEPALIPPVVETLSAGKISQGYDKKLILYGSLIKASDVQSAKVGFQFREYAGFVEELYSDAWQETATIEIKEGDDFSLKPAVKEAGKTYQYRAFVDHPKLRIYGDIKRVTF
jgi:hypothetical protein